MPNAQGDVYSAGTAVLLMELTKLITSTFMLFYRAYSVITIPKAYQPLGTTMKDDAVRHQDPSFVDRATLAYEEVKRLVYVPSALWLAVPAASYVAQNNLQLLAASHLEPALFQTFTQAKLITTAGFSVLIMKRHLHKFQWASIALLAIGLAIVHQTAEATNAKGHSIIDSHNVTIGFILMMAAALLSGFAGVFTERMLKQDRDFWATNFHMSLFSMLPALTVLLSSYVRDSRYEAFKAFGGWAWTTVILNAFGGLIVSMVLKYADSIAKGFSLAAAVILTVFVNVTFFGAFFSFTCLFGIMTVLLSTTLYVAVGSMKSKASTVPMLPTRVGHDDSGDTTLFDSSQSFVAIEEDEKYAKAASRSL